MDLLTKFHENRTVNVASRVLTRCYYSHIRKNAPPLGSDVFQANITIFELIQDNIETNLLTKFHEDWTINVASRLLTRKNAPPLMAKVLTRINIAILGKLPRPRGGHVFQPTGIISKLVQDIIEMNLHNKFHEDRTVNVASRVNNAPPLGSHVFQANVTIFKLIQDINKTNLLTKFHEDWTINLTSRALTMKIAPPPEDIIRTNLLTMFNADPKLNVASRLLIRKNAPHLGSHVFQANITIFELIQDIIGTNLLYMFHEDRKINVSSRVLTRKNALPPGGHVFIPTGIIFQLIQNIIRINLITKFHEDRTINVASRVLTRFYYSHIKPYKEKCPAPWLPFFFQVNLTIFKLIQDIIETNL
ncbi:hypothetical protein DPMN_161242 [Dreissena polymorpha]|uniref:Uncharacterized protein n=1 Tax=Dreissena polymorpha TaxID=45954 RepID=A0A9D4ISI0_DREPO|nr:hypothetical protein DPMN_161242 [Dreissena polymorpha]